MNGNEYLPADKLPTLTYSNGGLVEAAGSCLAVAGATRTMLAGFITLANTCLPCTPVTNWLRVIGDRIRLRFQGYNKLTGRMILGNLRRQFKFTVWYDIFNLSGSKKNPSSIRAGVMGHDIPLYTVVVNLTYLVLAEQSEPLSNPAEP